MYALIISLLLSIHPLPTDSLREYYETIPVPAGSDAGYDVAADNPFNCGKICPDWSSCRIDSTGKRRNKFVEYHFPVTCERSIKSIYTGSGRGSLGSEQRKKYGLPVKSELVFRFQNDCLEYIAVRHTVYRAYSDTAEFKTGLLADVDPFSNQLQSLWLYEGGKIAMEYLWLGSPTYNPNYANSKERSRSEAYCMFKDIAPSWMMLDNVPCLPEKNTRLWYQIRYQLTRYRYFYNTAK